MEGKPEPTALEREQQARLNAALLACGVIGLLCYLPFDVWMVPERWQALWAGRLSAVALLVACLAWQYRRPARSERALLIGALGTQLYLSWGASQVVDPYAFFFWNQSQAVAMFVLLPVVGVWRLRCMLLHNLVMLVAYATCFVVWSPFGPGDLLRLGGVFLIIGWLISPLLSYVRYDSFHRAAALSQALRLRNAELTRANQALAARQRELTYLANYDAMTELANRRWGMVFLREALDDCRRRGLPLSVLLVDIDGLKVVNDAHGHACGDRLIRHVAGGIADQLRPGELACRLGGDEFLMILPGVPAVDGEARGRRLAEALAATPWEAAMDEASVSVGVAEASPRDAGAGGLDALIQRADSAMYVHKRHARARYRAARDTDAS